MISLVRRSLLAVAATSLLAVTSACGGSSSPSAGPAEEASAGAASATVTTTADSSSKKFCAVVKQQETLLQGGAVAGLLAGGSTSAWKAYLDQTAAMNQQLVDAAPADIRASVQTLQQATAQLKSALEAANYDVTKVGSAKLLKIIQTPQRTAATSAVVLYVKTQCGIDLTTPAG
jgi:hypothetical protein